MNSNNHIDQSGRRIVRGVPLASLETITKPVLVLHGRDDRVIPDDVAVNVHKAIDQSDLVLFGKTGHWVQLERAGDFVREVTSFLDRIKW